MVMADNQWILTNPSCCVMGEETFDPTVTEEEDLMKPNRWLHLLFLLTVAALVFSHCGVFAAQPVERKKVLILFTFRPTLPVASRWHHEIASIFDAESNIAIDLDIEYLDLSRFSNSRYLQMVLNVFRYKGSESRPDLIIPVYEPALQFVLKHGRDIFANVPIVFGGVHGNFVEKLSLEPHITGHLRENNYAVTLELALDLHPDTRHVVVFAGADPVGRQRSATAREAFRAYEDRIDFSYLIGLPMDALVEKLTNLPAQTVIMAFPFLKDATNKQFVFNQVLSQITPVTSAPVYTFWDTAIGTGIVGGNLINLAKEAQSAARLGLRILKGDAPADIPIAYAPMSSYMFDWRQLKRWSIAEDKLPPGSIIRFREPTVWDLYKGRIIGGLGLIVFQAVIILLLLHQRRRRRLTEDQLKGRLQFEHKLSELSSEFINLSPEKLDAKMNDALAWIGPFMQADRCHTFRFNLDRTEFRITNLWEDEGIKKDEFVLPGLIVKDAFPWLFEKLIGGRDVIIRDIETDLLPEAENEYRYCREIGIRSFIILPIEIENAPLCAIGLDAIRQKKQWPQEIQDRLRIIGQIFANTIVRRHAEKRFEEDSLRYRTVADFTYDWEYWQNRDGSLQYVSPSCERICGYSAHELMADPALLQEMILPEDRAVWEAHRAGAQNEMRPAEIQFRIQKPNGEIRWIEHACQPVFDDQGNNQGIRASNRDITRREYYRSETQKLQSELAHMDRVVTISALTSALAHEINQPLAAMRSYAQAALRFMEKDQPEYANVRKALHGIVGDNKRAAEVVNRLRDLVKKGAAHREKIEINSIINEVIALINSELVLRNAAVDLDLRSDLPPIEGDAVQMQQVLINLLTNALDAMDDQPIGARTIAISTRPAGSNEIAVSIADSGKGVAPGTFETIFSAFHTTKSTGMGLGLSICKSIIEAHGGEISAENNPDGGALFSIVLPAGKYVS